MADAKKVSFNQATAKATAGHNDRSMYKHGYEERSNNWHWDIYGCGSSVEAEERFYEDMFTPTLEAQNDKARKMRKYDRVMDMKTWQKKHPPKEAIVQLGDVNNNDTSLEFAKGAAKKIERAIHRAGGIVLSIDLHCDERTIDEDGNEIVGTPHLHVRYVFVGENKDKNPVIDMKNVLLAHGVQPPNPDKPISKTNNPAQTFLETTRTVLEDYADEVELKHGNPRVNRDRTKRAHSSVQEYKTRKRLEELWEQEKEAIAARDNAFAERDAALAEAASKASELDEWEETLQNGETDLKRRLKNFEAQAEDVTNRQYAVKALERANAEQRAAIVRDARKLQGERQAFEEEKRVFRGKKKDLVKRETTVSERETALNSLIEQFKTWWKGITDWLDEQLTTARLEEAKQQVDEMASVVVKALDEFEDEPHEDETYGDDLIIG